MTTTILITGATGTTGSEIIRQLSAQGISARALTRNPAKAAALPHIDFVAGDLGDPASLTAAFDGIEAIYLNVVPGPDALGQIDNAIAAAKAAGVKRIVKLSGLHASPESASAIIRMHAEADHRVRTSGIGYTIIRANSFFQNIESQLAGIKAQGQFYLPLGESRQSLIDVADIAAVAILALTTDAHLARDYDLTGPEALTFHDVAAALTQARDSTVAYVPISNDAFADSLRSNGVPEAAAASVAELFAVFATGIYAAPTGDVSAILGRAPRSVADYAQTLFASGE
jgi:uncharacterized protein YbjT (DUF2867 family)